VYLTDDNDDDDDDDNDSYTAVVAIEGWRSRVTVQSGEVVSSTVGRMRCFVTILEKLL